MRDAPQLEPGFERHYGAGAVGGAAADLDLSPAILAAQGQNHAALKDFDLAAPVLGLVGQESAESRRSMLETAAGWFAQWTRTKLQRGVHRSTAALEADICAFIEAHNENPKPYIWVKSASEILASVKRVRQKTEQTLCGELRSRE